MRRLTLLFFCTITVSSIFSSNMATAMRAFEPPYPAPVYPYTSFEIELRQPPESKLDNYIKKFSDLITGYGKNPNILVQSDIDRILVGTALDKQADHASRILFADQNGDGEVTQEEAKQFLINEYQKNTHAYGLRSDRPNWLNSKSITNPLQRFMALDSNEDGIITSEEMHFGSKTEYLAHSNYEKAQLINTLQWLLDNSPNGNGMLTLKEVQMQARNAFNKWDLNHDGIISNNEVREFEKVKSKTWPSKIELSQLVAEKKIVRLKTSADREKAEYKIIKPIPHYVGVYNVNFLLGRGVPLPNGILHDCVISEESGDLLFGGDECN